MTATTEVKGVVLSVPNISCGHCVMTITRELKKLDAVKSVEGRAERKEVTVEFAGDALGEIKSTLVEIGYPVAE